MAKREIVRFGDDTLRKKCREVTEFDEKLWHAVVDRVTVYNDDRLVYLLKDGSEITVML